MMKLVMESDRDREEQLWVKNEELMEMRMNVEIKDQQIKVSSNSCFDAFDNV